MTLLLFGGPSASLASLPGFRRSRLLFHFGLPCAANFRDGAGARKTDSNQPILALNGTHLGPAKLHVTHSKDDIGLESGLRILSNVFILNNLAERVGFEFTRKRSFNNIERTTGTVKQWKAVVSSANGSQTDHE